MKKIFLTGSTGFLGSYILAELIKNKFEITALARKSSDISQIPGSTKIVYGNLLDIESLKKAMSGTEMIVNVAASTPNRDLSGQYLANTVGVENLIKSAKYTKIRKIVHISSISVLFNNRGKYRETKLKGEQIIINSGLDFILLRPTGIYGKGSVDFEKSLRMYGALPFALVFGDGQHRLQPVYVEDVAKSVVSIINHGKLWNRIYNLAGPENISFVECVDKICKALSIKKPKLYAPKALLTSLAKILEVLYPQLKVNPERVNILFQNSMADISPAKRDFNYNPIKFEKGLEKTITLLKYSIKNAEN